MLKIKDVMTEDVFTLTAWTPAETAARELRLRGVTGAPVRDQRGRWSGFCRAAIWRPGTQPRPHAEPGGPGPDDAGLLHAGPVEPVSRARPHGARSHRPCVVIDDTGRLVGIVTSSDILRGVDDTVGLSGARVYGDPSFACT